MEVLRKSQKTHQVKTVIQLTDQMLEPHPPPQGPPVQSPTATDQSVTQQVANVPLPSQQTVIQF